MTEPQTLTATCAYPLCDRQPRPAEDRAGAKPKYCGEPDPVTGKPHTALTAFRRRQELGPSGWRPRRASRPGPAGHDGHGAGCRAARWHPR